MQFGLMEELTCEVAGAENDHLLHGALSHAARRMGFDHFALAYDRWSSVQDGMLVHDYPDEWAKVYVGFDLRGADPIRRAGERSMTGFAWRRQLASLITLTQGDHQMLMVGRENGIGDGFTVPRHLPGEASGSCSFVVGPEKHLPGEMFHVAEIIGAFALARARHISGVAPPKSRPVLSERQRECVLWSARGKTASEIAIILGIREVTVIRHLKIARERYDVHCRQALILCALFDGLIGFGDIFDWRRMN
jgi:DNA-binding HTH domain-containing proteins